MLSKTSGQSGYIFNIQRYSLHDGPGIRTVVFLKGCPLRCHWCSNPESQLGLPELAFNKSKCISSKGCSRCEVACKHGAISRDEQGSIAVDRSLCKRCFSCSLSCPSKALHTFGRQIDVTEVLKVIEADSAFYSRSGGGLTISGGEPLMQADFVLALLQAARKRRIDTAIETCGFAPWEDFKRIAPYLKIVLYDIKSMDAVKHKKFTGVSNELILNNLVKLRQEFPALKVIVRTPVIPGFNDSEDDIQAIRAFLKDLPGISHELLPYHRLGQQKYEYLGRTYPMKDDARLDEQLLALLTNYKS